MCGLFVFLFGQIVFGERSDAVIQLLAGVRSYALSSYCPELTHFIEGKAVKFAEAHKRCEAARGSLPRREAEQLKCLTRFFEEIEENSLAAHFSTGLRKNLPEFTQKTSRLWFFGDDQHKIHGKRIAKGDKRHFVCTMPGNSRNRCNSSLLVHDEPLPYVEAQRFCQNSSAHLPRRSKGEDRCVQNYFPGAAYTWFEGRRPDLLAPLSGERCSTNSSQTDPCPPESQFICVTNRFRVDAPKTSLYFSSVSSSKVILASKQVSVDEELRSSSEGRGTDDAFVIRAHSAAFPALYCAVSAAVEFCFEKQEDLKLLDREHTNGWFLTFALSAASHDTFWVMPRNKSEISLELCPYVEVNLTSRAVTRGSRNCRERALAACEARVCPQHSQSLLGETLVWPASRPLETVSKPCSKTHPETYASKTCSLIGYWQTSGEPCPSKEAWFKSKLSNLTAFDERTDWIRSSLRKDKSMLEVLYRARSEIARSLSVPTGETGARAERLMVALMPDAIRSVDSKTGLSQVAEIGREFLGAFGSKLRINEVVKSEEYESFGFALSKVNLTSAKKGNPEKIVSQVRDSKVELIISGSFDGASSSSVVVGHIVMYNFPSQILAPDDSGSWAEASVNTPLVEFFISDGEAGHRISVGEVKVRISFRHLRAKTRKSSVKCVFHAPESQDYSDYGCSLLVEASTSEVSICVCNHTTAFAALLLPSEFAITHAQSKFLQYMTAIGMPLSMFCLLICIPIFTFVRRQHEERNTIHRNLCISLLGGDIALVASSYGDHLMNCTLHGSLVHFCFLSSLSWMGLEGVHIIHVMWLVFTKAGIPLMVYYVLGYGIPLVIVAGTNFGFQEAYDRTAQLCFLSRDNMAILTFMVPLTVIFCVNSLAISVVFYRMRTVKSAKDKNFLRAVQKWTRGVAVLLPLLGLPWLFGLLMLADDRELVVVSAVIFNIFVILQGPGIFLTQVWFSNKKRESIARWLVAKGRMAQLVARIFAHSRESTESSSKSSKLSKSSTSARTGVQSCK